MTQRNCNEFSSEGAPAKITGRQWLTVLLLLGTGFMLSVDFSILNVALPQVGAAVGIQFADLPWIATAYALPAAGFTLLFGRVADLFGRRRAGRGHGDARSACLHLRRHRPQPLHAARRCGASRGVLADRVACEGAARCAEQLALGANAALVVIAVVLTWMGLRARPGSASDNAQSKRPCRRPTQAAAA